MQAIAFDCRAIADRWLDWVRAEIDRMPQKPTIATLLYSANDNEASLKYRNLILKDADRLGIPSVSYEAGSEADLLAVIRRLNEDPAITGMIVLYPLRASIPDEDVMDLVSEAKDLEGLHSTNLGYLIKYKMFLDAARQVKCVVPATAKAVVKTLQAYPEIKIRGSFVAIINNSMRVGKPLGLMLENLGATVIKGYDLTTPDVMETAVRKADLIVTAVPSPDFRLQPEWIKDGAVVFDLSYQGNVDIEQVRAKASFVTSTENRIGQVTRAMILVNLIYCAHRQQRK